MVAEITAIQQDIAQIKQDAADIAQQAQAAYQKYLGLLGRSGSRQLILSSYHLCTQSYPQNFVQLSLDQQQSLQQALQAVGKRLQETLAQILQQLHPLLSSQAPASQVEPEDVLAVLQTMEKSVLTALREQSVAVNRLLQEGQIIPAMAIDLLFDVAAKASEQGRSITTTPHLITALMDDSAGTESEREHGPVVAIFLQLSDLEFTDVEVMHQRHQIRQLWQQLKTLQEALAQKQQEEVVARAIAAWRASWFAPEDPQVP